MFCAPNLTRQRELFTDNQFKGVCAGMKTYVLVTAELEVPQNAAVHTFSFVFSLIILH